MERCPNILISLYLLCKCRNCVFNCLFWLFTHNNLFVHLFNTNIRVIRMSDGEWQQTKRQIQQSRIPQWQIPPRQQARRQQPRHDGLRQEQLRQDRQMQVQWREQLERQLTKVEGQMSSPVSTWTRSQVRNFAMLKITPFFLVCLISEYFYTRHSLHKLVGELLSTLRRRPTVNAIRESLFHLIECICKDLQQSGFIKEIGCDLLSHASGLQRDSNDDSDDIPTHFAKLVNNLQSWRSSNTEHQDADDALCFHVKSSMEAIEKLIGPVPVSMLIQFTPRDWESEILEPGPKGSKWEHMTQVFGQDQNQSGQDQGGDEDIPEISISLNKQ